MSKIEESIRKGNYTKEDNNTYVVTVYGSKFTYKERINANTYAAICDRIRRQDFRWSVNNYTAEHSADMSEIYAAYADYKRAMAF